MMEMSARGPYGPKMGIRSDSVIRLGTWPTKSLALVAVVVVVAPVVVDVAWPLLVADAPTTAGPEELPTAGGANEDIATDSCISGIAVEEAAAADDVRC